MGSAPMGSAQAFLRELWGPKPPGLVQLWRLADRRSWYLRSLAGADFADGQTDLYTGVALAGEDHGRSRRARAGEVVALAGLWLDIDDYQDADLAHRIAEPTLLVDSGHGVHAWHLFDEPWHFKDLTDQAAAATGAAQWHHLHRTYGAAHGFGPLDATHDLARLMRVPGTLNGKDGGGAPVTVIDADGPRHRRGDLLALCAQAGDVPTRAAASGELPVVDVGPGRALSGQVLEALIENSPEFKRTWLHAREAHWSTSEYDLALCSIAAQAGLTDQQLADLIALHRRTWNASDPKAERQDYVARTVAKARDSASKAADVEWFRKAGAAA